MKTKNTFTALILLIFSFSFSQSKRVVRLTEKIKKEYQIDKLSKDVSYITVVDSLDSTKEKLKKSFINSLKIVSNKKKYKLHNESEKNYVYYHEFIVLESDIKVNYVTEAKFKDGKIKIQTTLLTFKKSFLLEDIITEHFLKDNYPFKSEGSLRNNRSGNAFIYQHKYLKSYHKKLTQNIKTKDFVNKKTNNDNW